MVFVKCYECNVCGKKYNKSDNMVILFIPDDYDILHFCDIECLKKWLNKVSSDNDKDENMLDGVEYVKDIGYAQYLDRK